MVGRPELWNGSLKCWLERSATFSKFHTQHIVHIIWIVRPCANNCFFGEKASHCGGFPPYPWIFEQSWLLHVKWQKAQEETVVTHHKEILNLNSPLMGWKRTEGKFIQGRREIEEPCHPPMPIYTKAVSSCCCHWWQELWLLKHCWCFFLL